MIQIGPDKHCGPVEGSCDDVRKWAKVTLQPKEQGVIEVSPPAGWFANPGPAFLSRLGTFRTRVEDASLWLAVSNDTPKRTLPLKANLSGSFYIELVWIVSLLGLGAMMSLLVRYWVPNIAQARVERPHAPHTNPDLRHLRGDRFHASRAGSRAAQSSLSRPAQPTKAWAPTTRTTVSS